MNNFTLIACSITAFIGGVLTALALVAYLHEEIGNALRRYWAKNRYWPDSAVQALKERDARIKALERSVDIALDSRIQALLELRRVRDENRSLEVPELIRAELHAESFFHRPQAG